MLKFLFKFSIKEPSTYTSFTPAKNIQNTSSFGSFRWVLSEHQFRRWARNIMKRVVSYNWFDSPQNVVLQSVMFIKAAKTTRNNNNNENYYVIPLELDKIRFYCWTVVTKHWNWKTSFQKKNLRTYNLSLNRLLYSNPFRVM